MKHNIVQEKTFEFALDIVKLGGRLRADKEYVLSRQLLRSGTGSGANIEEAIVAQSRADFLSKLAIARKEARETRYWLRLLQGSDLSEVDVTPEPIQVESLLHLLTSSIKSTEDASHQACNS